MLPEVLAPAGDRACLEAAVSAGADAVYLGLGGAFNARARATGFDEKELEEALRYLHRHGRRGHVTLNTLVFDEELPAFERALRVVAEAGADAILVQDLGVLALARAIAPSLPVHASTQMTCTDPGSVRFARSLGAERVVLARELSVAEIRAIATAVPDVELEVFVHGALCVAYSGQCLTSEAIGGRSANRGACAQACRLPYELVVDGALRDLGDRAYLLSPEDLEASALVPELAEAGVRSLKIEGRLKTPAYVAATTRLYRAAVDALAGGKPPERAEVERALQTYTRGSGPGFLAGVDHQRLVDGRTCDHRGLVVGEVRSAAQEGGRTVAVVTLSAPVARGDGLLFEGAREGRGEIGGRVWALSRAGRDVEEAEPGTASIWLGPDVSLASVRPGARVFATNAPRTIAAIERELAAGPRRTPLTLTLTATIGAPAELRARTPDGREERVTLERPTERARERPTDRAAIVDAVGTLGDTPFVLGALELTLPDGAMLPLSALKKARRALLASLVEQRHRVHTTGERPAPVPVVRPARALPPGLFVLARTGDQARAALDAGAAGVYLDFLALTGAGATLRALRTERPNAFVGLAPPRIRKPGEEKIDRYLLGERPDALLVRSLGAVYDAGSADDGIARIGDFSLNVASAATARVLFGHLDVLTPSFDLDQKQLLGALEALGPLARRTEVVLHHPMPLFHMEHCVFAALLSNGKDHRDCGRPCEHHALSLRDRAGMDHPVEADVGCRNTVFHARAQSGAALSAALRSLGVERFRVELVREDANSTAAIVAAYRALLDGRSSPREIFSELRTEAGVGVVRGSLRVLA